MSLSQPDLTSPDFQSKLAREITRRFNVAPKILLLGGSAVEGLATRRSDLDLVAVTFPDTDVEGASKNILSTRILGIKCEILLIDEARFVDIIFDRPNVEWANKLDYIDMRRRLITSIPIFGAGAYESVSRNVDRTAFAKDISIYCMTRADSYFDDVIGLVDAGRIDEATIASRAYLENLSDAVLATAGDLYFRGKWRLARVLRTFPRHVGLAPLCDITSQGLMGSEWLKSDGEAVIARNCQLALWCAILANFQDAIHTACPALLLDPRNGSALTPSALVSLLPSRAGGFLIRCGNRAFQMDHSLGRAIAICAAVIDPDSEAVKHMLSGDDRSIHARASTFVREMRSWAISL